MNWNLLQTISTQIQILFSIFLNIISAWWKSSKFFCFGFYCVISLLNPILWKCILLTLYISAGIPKGKLITPSSLSFMFRSEQTNVFIKASSQNTNYKAEKESAIDCEPMYKIKNNSMVICIHFRIKSYYFITSPYSLFWKLHFLYIFFCTLPWIYLWIQIVICLNYSCSGC